ncbi:hypothetical protein [Vibrio sp. HN007]|uniref:tetratricopeptide repeat protein n=1 Tax=Vibrio iocasae TaxID=3098914 RepID=UPI0035D4A474
MNNKKYKRSLLLLALTLGVYVPPSYVVAAQNLSNYTVRKVQKAYQFQQEERVSDAIELLADIEPSREYDKAYVNRMLGNLYWQTGQKTQSINRLTLSVDSDVLPEQQQRDTSKMLADILLTEGEYKQAEVRYQGMLQYYSEAENLEWLWLRIAQAQYQQKKWTSVEQSVDNQQKFQKQAGMKPKIMPLNMKLTAQLAQKKYEGAIYTTRAIRELEPDNHLWWKQLTSLYLYTTNYDKALETLKQTERAGFELSRQRLELMAQLYAQAKVPYKAAETYQRLADKYGSADYIVQVASNWQTAKEWGKAESSWYQAAKEENKHFKEYALLKLRLRKYQEALDAIDKVPDKDASMLLTKAGALSSLGDNKAALEVATLAHKMEPSKSTLGWIKYLSKLD